MMYQAVGDGYAVFASKAGADSNPDWFYNLKAHADASIEVGTDVVEVTARVLDDAERGADLGEAEGRLPRLRRLRGEDRPGDPGRSCSTLASQVDAEPPAHPLEGPSGLGPHRFLVVVEPPAHQVDVLRVADDGERAERLGPHPWQVVRQPRARRRLPRPRRRAARSP